MSPRAADGLAFELGVWTDSVVPLEINLIDGRTFEQLLADLSAQLATIHRTRWCAGVDVLAQLNAIFKRPGQAAVPYVISSALATGTASAAFSALSRDGGEVRSTYDPPQVLVDVIVNESADGSAHIMYHHNAEAFVPQREPNPPLAFCMLTGRL